VAGPERVVTPHRPPTAGLQRERLANGVTLLVQRRRTVPGVALVCHMRAGFLDEPDALVGISHVLEHMLFKGTPTLGPGELARRSKALGGSLNAYTAYDRTVYYMSGPARHARELIALQADQIQRSVLDAGELERELGVIIQEARRKLDTPSAVAGETLHQLLFTSHRIRRWRIGIESDLERLTRDEVAGYYASRYLPARTIVAAVGDVDEEALLDALHEAWGGWQGSAELPPAGPGETSTPAFRTRTMHGQVATGSLVVGWRGPGVLDPDVPALELGAAVLTGGRASRLMRQLRDPGWVTGVGAAQYGVIDTGVVAIGAELLPEHLATALPLLGAAVHDLTEQLVDADEFERARMLHLLRLRRRLARFEARATALADAESLGDVTRLDREEAELLAVDRTRLRDIAARYFGRPGAAVWYAPDGSAPLEVDRLQAALGAPSRTPPPVRPGPWEIRSAPVTDAVHESAFGVERFATGGVDVLAARHGDDGQVAVSVYRRRHDIETPATAGVAMLAIRSMVRGTRRRDQEHLAAAAESLGAVVVPVLSTDVIGFSMTVAAGDADRAAGLLVEVLTEPRFDPALIDAERAVLVADAASVADDMVRYPFQLAFGAAFGDSGYGSPALGTAGALAGFDAATVREWHAAMLDRGPTTVIAVGDLDPVRAGPALLAASKGAAPRSSVLPPPAPPDRVHPGVRVARRSREQAALAMLFPGPARTDPDRFAAEVWSAIAGGLGGRLFESLRSELSLAYTVMASSWQRARAGALTTYIAMAPERLDEARQAMLAQLEAFRAAPPSEEEVGRAVSMLAGQTEIAWQTAGAYAAAIADAWLFGRGLEELEEPAARYRAVTADAVHRLARRMLDPAHRAEGVVEPGVK
jgi:zinc protease